MCSEKKGFDLDSSKPFFFAGFSSIIDIYFSEIQGEKRNGKKEEVI